ncbi:mitochondrial inner membrane protein Mitofilin [Cokeromyces recurvatus]|uniref:mitochondrial inner membrane protein Mitofilin n=1 Tax=Cokeromyces recurvatus TaxID=90255 RepID=UPI002221067D|nr:mitochondrial inner membrane protein Mitofilin [Cokeromyces recurvatus]KAI7899087.1 mitochondrial inner membrane protein Mitofilin [Cokeromyces recurvatus]
MLRASKLYNNGAVRSGLKISHNQRLGVKVFKHCESTLAEEPKKPSRSLFTKFLGLTFVLGASYGGAAYYALHEPAFHKHFRHYVPGGEQTLRFLEDLQNNNDTFLQKATNLKEQAKSYSTKIQQSSQDAMDYAAEAYQTLTGPKLPDNNKIQTFTKKEQDVSISVPVTPKPTTNSTLQLSTDKAAQPAIVNVAIEKPEPIIVKQVASDNPYVRELSQLVTELATILNETGLSGLGRTIIRDAEEALEKLNDRIQTLNNDQTAILQSLQSLRSQGDKLEGSLERFHIQAKQDLELTQIESAAKIVAREAQLKNAFEQTRAEMETSFAQQLAADLEPNRSKVKLLVEQERAGRLAKLDVIDKRFKALEKYALQNAQQLDASRQRHVIHVALDALWNILEQSPHQQSFNDELQALNHNTKEDALIQTVLSVVPDSIAKEGVNTISELFHRFEIVSNEIRRVALVPEDGGFGSHIISWVMSFLMFKKEGLVEGDDIESILAPQDWIQSARRHLEVKQALEVAETEAVLLSLLEA